MRAKIRSIAEYDAGGGEARAFGHLDEVAFGFGAGVDEPQVAVVVVTQMQWGKVWWLLHKWRGGRRCTHTLRRLRMTLNHTSTLSNSSLYLQQRWMLHKRTRAIALDVTQTHACNARNDYKEFN